MTTIELFAKNEVLELVTSPTVSSGDVNEVELYVEFGEEWQGLAKVAVFFNDEFKEPFERLLENGRCKVPNEVLKNHVPFFVGIRGAKNNILKTTDIVKYTVTKGVPSIIKDVNVDIYQQILAGYAKLETIRDEVDADAKKTAEDRKEVERLTESNTQMQGEVAKDLEEVKKFSSQAQTSATNAALSEQKSEEAATRAETAQAGAETAEDNAELAAQKTGEDKTAVEQAKKLVQQMGQEVLDNKNAVDKTVQDFNLTAQQALADVNNAGQTQTERVQTAGTTAVGNIKTAQNTATQAVETAKSEAIKAVQTEGITQTGAVTAEGEKQVQAVQTAAQEIVEDREQIQKNKTDIADLRQKKADAIVENVSGTLLNVKDSASAFFEDFFMSGKTVQDGTPTPDAPVEVVNAGQDGTIEIKVTGKNLIPFPYPLLGGVGTKGTKNGITWEILKDRGIRLTGTATDDAYIDVLLNYELQDKEKFAYSKKLLLDTRNGKIFYAVNRGENINTVYYPQIEHGTVSTDYEPYRQPQTITLQIDRPLTKWDRLEKREGVWGIVRQSAKKTLDGTEGWYEYTFYKNETLHCYFTESIKCESGFKKSFCTHFTNTDGAWLNEIGKYGGYSDHKTLLSKYFISDKTTVEDFKAWLAQQKEAGTPVELVYKTAEEIWEPLPEEAQLALNTLHTNYPTTVVSNSEDAEMELSYVADTKNYTDRKIEETVSAQTQSLANLLSLMPLSTQAAMIEADTNNILDNMEVQK